ncbi:medium chain dehydrogenase/reductase family protein [soil metagenome]
MVRSALHEACHAKRSVNQGDRERDAVPARANANASCGEAIRGLLGKAMRQVWITKTGAPEVLQVREAPDPTAGKGEVRVRVKAAGINFADLMARVGLYPDAPKLPCVVGYEVAGLVDEVGEGVTDVKIGDRVMAMPYFGGYTDTLVVPEGQVIPMPEKMSFEQGAALPVVYITAYTALNLTGNVREGSTILLHSAAGGVGMAVLDLAKAKKCVVIGIASKSKHEFLRQNGCAHTIDNDEDYVEKTRAIVGDKGVDLVLDPVGGPSWARGYSLLGPLGRLVCFGFSSATTGQTRNIFNAAWQVMRVKKYSPLDLMADNRTVTGINMAHLFSRLDILRPAFLELTTLFERGLISPHVDKSFPFAEAGAAHAYIHDRKAKGKVLLVP